MHTDRVYQSYAGSSKRNGENKEVLDHLVLEDFLTHSIENVYDHFKWDIKKASIGENGKEVFRQDGVEAPDFWSQSAVNIVASKYFRGKLGTPQRECSVKQLVKRVVDTITKWGIKDEYFSESTGSIFNKELSYILLNQMASFNSPVWFNVGVKETPQCSACFIQSIEDDMSSIMDLAKSEVMLFKGGSGTGTNLSKLRSSKEHLSGGGIASGPVSFMKGYDAFAGVIKSGGATRRAAKIVLLDVDHPDIMDFITCKVEEEKKAHALIAQGYPSDFNGPAYSSLHFQNANNTVRVSDSFMEKAINGGSYDTLAVLDKRAMETLEASTVLKKIAEAAHFCGDPGLQFTDTVNRWNMCASTGPINACNPCQPDWATVLTPDGIRTFADTNVGSTIWSGKRWTKVRRKVFTGNKRVYRYETTAGFFVGTEEHRVLEEGTKTPVRDATSIDVCIGVKPAQTDQLIDQDIVDGLVFGDGSVKVTNDGNSIYTLLYVGNDDSSYFDSKIAPYITKTPFDKNAHLVKTTISAKELPFTYLRNVPVRFMSGTSVKVRGFLRGLYSANGSVCDGRVTLKASSKNVISSVQQMLSSLGIGSYYTSNREHDVSFSNGTYTCKESYDLNITTDRRTFYELIGFIQPYKNEKLIEAIERTKEPSRRKTSFGIKSVEFLGVEPVWDIEVEAEEHTYWTGGLLVSNCGEFVFLDNSACNLASINLIKFLKQDGRTFDTDKFAHVVNILIIAMDIIVSNSSYPTPAIEKNSVELRPLGLGFTNLGALLMATGTPYDSDEGRTLAGGITALMTATALNTSGLLAAVKTPFIKFSENKEHILQVIDQHMVHAESHDGDMHARACKLFAIAKHKALTCGLRNGQVTLLAPTGTISFMMDCDTTGIEPDISLIKFKKLVGGGSMRIVNSSVARALKCLGYSHGSVQDIERHINMFSTIEGSKLKDEDLPVFDCSIAHDGKGRVLSVDSHLKMMAACQPFLSGAISKTVNMPENSTVQDVFDVYVKAWKMGLKSVTIYRNNSKKSQPLSTKDISTPAIQTIKAKRRALKSERQSITHKFSVGGQTGYITVGLYEDGSPGEIFLQMAKEGSTISGLMDSFAIAVSVGLQYGVPLEVLVRRFSNVRFEPSGFTTNTNIRMAKSIIDYIFRWLSLKFLDSSEKEHSEKHEIDVAGPACQECGALTVRAGTCHVCVDCGTTTGCG